MRIFGINIEKYTIKREEPKIPSEQENTDGAITVSENHYGFSYDFLPSFENKEQRINQYRRMAEHSDISNAINEIVNDAIVYEDNGTFFDIDLDETSFSDNIKKLIQEENKNILNLLNYKENADEDFLSWYVDGSIYYHISFSPNENVKGIKKIVKLDSRKISFIKSVNKDTKKKEEYFLINKNTEKSKTQQKSDGIKLDKNSVAFAYSGITNGNGEILSHLDSTIKPYNQLNALEDALVVYRISRAPERRVFYVDVGKLPKQKAEQYMRSLMNNQKSKFIYDSKTGNVKNNSHTLSMMEDIWLPRRSSGRTTEVSTLPGGQISGITDEVEFFTKKLNRALKVPQSRLQQDAGFQLARSGEITRDELKFSRFINKLRSKFMKSYLHLLKIQLLDKNIIVNKEWTENKNLISIIFNSNSHFEELKNSEMISNRFELISNIDDYVGKYFSMEYVQKNILKFTDDDIKEMNDKIKEEKKSGIIPSEPQ